MSNLPPELIVDILSRIPPKDLIRFMCVRKLTMPPSMTESSSIRIRSSQRCGERPVRSLAFFDNDAFGTIEKLEAPLKRPGTCTHILGYSNGLVCIRNTKHRNLTLGRPCYGFGYDFANDDYKFVKIVEFLDGDGVITGAQVKVYSLKSNSWKRIQNMSANGFGVDSKNILFLKGALSWLTRNGGDNRYKILSLDLATEQCCEFPTPVNGDDKSILFLDVLGSFLCICVDHFYIRKDFWIMKKFGEAESWSLIYSLMWKLCVHRLAISNPWLFSKNAEMKRSIKQVEIEGRHENTTICVGSSCLLDGDSVILASSP
ncbi:unnamed protein product [Malus baccata var. baccata]